jgi:hypothetical protein|eukprot:Tamp_12578.p3 GENE.Tamp_12578~~Tamp_12578.p3  ORF type:complete len:149 (-),score=24.27 Tamp_12578:660-1106(-)
MVHSSHVRGIPPDARKRAFKPMQSQNAEQILEEATGDGKGDGEQEVQHCSAAQRENVCPAGKNDVAGAEKNDRFASCSSSGASAQQKSALANITSKYRQVHNRLPVDRKPMARKALDKPTKKPEPLDDEALIERHIRVYQGIASIDGA